VNIYNRDVLVREVNIYNRDVLVREVRLFYFNYHLDNTYSCIELNTKELQVGLKCTKSLFLHKFAINIFINSDFGRLWPRKNHAFGYCIALSLAIYSKKKSCFVVKAIFIPRKFFQEKPTTENILYRKNM